MELPLIPFIAGMKFIQIKFNHKNKIATEHQSILQMECEPSPHQKAFFTNFFSVPLGCSVPTKYFGWGNHFKFLL